MPAPTSPGKPARPPSFNSNKLSRPASSSPTKSTRPASASARAASSTLPHRRASPAERAEQAHWADFYREYNDGLASIDRVLGALQTAQSTTRGKPVRLSVDRLMANVAPAELDVEVDGGIPAGEPAIVVSRYASEAEQLARDARDAQEDEGGASDRSVTPVGGAAPASYRDLDERMSPARAADRVASIGVLHKRLAEKNTTISNLHFRLRQLEREVQWTRVQAQAASGRSAADAGDPALRDRVRAAEARLARDARDLHALNAQNEILRAENRRLIEMRIAAGSPAALTPTGVPTPVVQVAKWMPDPALAAHTAAAVRQCQAAGVMSAHFPRFAPVLARAAAVAESAAAGADVRAWEEAVHRTLVELAGAVTAHLADLARDEQDRAAKARLPASRESVESEVLDRSVQCVAPVTKSVATATVAAEMATVKVGTASVGVASVGTTMAPATTVGIGTSMTAFSTETATQFDSVPPPRLTATGTDPATAAHDAVDRMRAHLIASSPVPVPRPHSGGARSPADDETAFDRLVLQLMALKQENEVLRAKQRRKHHHKKAESKAPPAPPAPPKHDPHVQAMDELRAAVVALEARLAHPPPTAAPPAVPKPPAMVTVATGPSFIAPASDDSGSDDDDADDEVAWDLPQQKIEIHGAPSPAPAATDMSFVAVADMAPLLRQIGTLAQANHDLLARQAELEQLLADARDDAPRRKLHLEYESKLADLADQLAAAQSQATSLATAVPQLANEIESRDRALAALRAALEQAETRVVSDEIERRVAALHAAVVEQHRAADTVWDQVRSAAPISAPATTNTADAEIRALVAQHAARVADLSRARDLLASDLATARTDLAATTAALNAERDALRAVTDRAVAATQRADAAESVLAGYAQMWAAAAAHLPSLAAEEGAHPKPFLTAIQTLARARDAQAAAAKSATQRMQAATRRADEADASCADARRQIDHLAEMVARAERARDTAVSDARRARAEAVERVKVADVARRAAQARLKRVLSGVYAYVAGGSGGEEEVESDVSLVSDASVDATLEALRGARARAAQRDGPSRAVWAAAARRGASRVDAHDVHLSVVTGYDDDDDDDDDDGDDELDATTTTTVTGSVSSFLDASAAAASSRGGRAVSASLTKSAAVENAAVPGLAPSPSPADRRDRDRAPVLPGV
ncbi:hypothetical protein GGF32_005062 [Allomyces javanicus]|nr:hypothetical protein GGF32_005062 [Allomyces javanicus]